MEEARQCEAVSGPCRHRRVLRQAEQAVRLLSGCEGMTSHPLFYRATFNVIDAQVETLSVRHSPSTTNHDATYPPK
jgi:hypothetical protein